MSDITNTMAHEEAENTMAVESYLLNELTEEQRMRFEEHYFECAACADAVEAGQVFIRGVRSLPKPVSWWRRLGARLGAPIALPAWGMCVLGGATAASLAMVAFQDLYVPTVPLANTVLLAKETVKGPGDDKPYSLRTPSATVEVPLLDPPAFPFYRVDILRAEGGNTRSQVVPAPPPDSERRLSVQTTSRALGAGRFTVTVSGLDSREAKQGHPIETYYFEINKSD
jgi:hypothetical protein